MLGSFLLYIEVIFSYLFFIKKYGCLEEGKDMF